MNAQFPKVLSVGFAVPEEHYYTQRELFDAFGYYGPFWPLFKNAGIEGRYFAMPKEKVLNATLQEQQECYAEWARIISNHAAEECLEGWNRGHIGSLSFASCTGICPGPTMGHLLAQDLVLPFSTYVTNILYQGCDGGFPAFKRGIDYTLAHKGMSLIIACELSSCAYGQEEKGPKGEPDPENEYELIRAHAIFGDGCSAVLIGYDDDPRHPVILDTSTFLQTQYQDELGFIWRDGRLRIRLGRRVPDIATHLAGTAARGLLTKWNLTSKDINHWIVHPAGAKVLGMIQEELQIPDKNIRFSYDALKRYGNCSSSTVGIIGKLMMREEICPEGYAMMLNVGPGMTGDATLFHFGS
jgi:alkylresorcinol/alkylpyrone synthase